MRTFWRALVSTVGRAGAITAGIGAVITIAGMVWVAVPPPPEELGTPITPGFVLATGLLCMFLGLAYGYLNGRKQ